MDLERAQGKGDWVNIQITHHHNLALRLKNFKSPTAILA
ncbi:hypothetical protein NOC27_2615 [Nitrosococcus oceani AFC27]|nr:hypothetical protein NOC27_2615 [Nitrosococcus oceani AFC27]